MMMRLQKVSHGFDTEGFHANEYLTKSRVRWESTPSSQLIVTLSAKVSAWKKAEEIQPSAKTKSTTLPKQLGLNFEVSGLFESLATWWRKDTKHTSNMNKALAHPAYQQIIGIGKALGPQVIPLLLKELAQRPDHWFHALVEIAGTDPAAGEDTFNGAVRSWLDWGKREGYC